MITPDHIGVVVAHVLVHTLEHYLHSSIHRCCLCLVQAAWEQAVVQDVVGGMAALCSLCRDLEQAHRQGLARLHSLHQAHTQIQPRYTLPNDAACTAV